MARDNENRGFICRQCGAQVRALSNGSYRNHCPVCLASVHVDVRPGDRASDCGGLMRAVGLAYRRKKGWQIVHRCTRCGFQGANRIADDSVQPDDVRAVAKLSGLETAAPMPISGRR